MKHWYPQLDNGYAIFRENGEVYKSGLTHEQAWDLLDKLRGEHTSIKERNAEWLSRKDAGRLH